MTSPERMHKIMGNEVELKLDDPHPQFTKIRPATTEELLLAQAEVTKMSQLAKAEAEKEIAEANRVARIKENRQCIKHFDLTHRCNNQALPLDFYCHLHTHNLEIEEKVKKLRARESQDKAWSYFLVGAMVGITIGFILARIS